MTDMKMNPEKKRIWVEALRSGKYEQAQNCLYDGKGGHCCLAVELAAVNGCKFRWLQRAMTEDMSNLLSADLGGGIMWGPLVRMNDQEGLNFNQIADWIEKNL